jgi:uncharacterized protein YceK
MKNKRMVILIVAGTLGLTGCGSSSGGPYSGRPVNYFVTHNKSRIQEMNWCVKHRSGTATSKTCDAAIQASDRVASQENSALSPSKIAAAGPVVNQTEHVPSS